jgi:hypothetical protein
VKEWYRYLINATLICLLFSSSSSLDILLHLIYYIHVL